MTGMGNWLNNIPVTTPETPNERGRTPLAPPETPAAPPPEATTPEAPTPPVDAPEVLPADLRAWLMQYYSGYNVLPQEMYDLYGGDDVLAQLQKFDPNARWTQTAQYGGEGGEGPMGYRLDFDPSKLPTVGGPGGDRTIFETGFRPVFDNDVLRNAEMVYDDPYYGRVTPYQNVQQERDPWWTIAAPIAVSLLAPYAGAALAGAGIGGSAGLTAAATGSGLSAASSSAPWWTQIVKRAPQIAEGVSGIMGAQSAPKVNPNYTTPPMFPDYDPTKFNNAGSASKPHSNEASLVANDFAPDPYGFSKGIA